MLFAPLTIRDITLRNRIVMSPHRTLPKAGMWCGCTKVLLGFCI